MKILQNSKIIANRKLSYRFYKVIIRAPEIAREAKPGQFLHIRVNKGFEPLLRRPFSIHRVRASMIEILYEVVGKGTQILSQKKAGESLDVIGPLGNGFDIKSKIKNQKSKILLVAGGMGVAPLMFLAEKLKKNKPLILIGAKTRKRLLCEKEFRQLGCEVKISTDDGSIGLKGKVTELLNHLLSTLYSLLSTSTIYACGSKEMLKEIAKITQQHKIPCQVSLEENMGCGLGACLACVVKTKDGYKRACKDGPIFNTDEIVW